jgi:SAM-dependent methyltransferase
MTYGTVHGGTTFGKDAADFGTPEFFRRVDEGFYAWNHSLATPEGGPFAKIFPYERYRGKKVIEIGCGMGTMAMHWAMKGARIHAADLNPRAVEQTSQRLRLLNLPGQVIQVDGNVLPFEDASFDYAYSWGVLHHSPDLGRSMKELMRVVRPGGEFGIMLYQRESLLYHYTMRFMEGYLNYESKFLNPLQLASRYSDGDRDEGNPHTWPVTRDEMREMLGPYSENLQFRILGTDLDFQVQEMLVWPRLMKLWPVAFRKPWARRWGWSLWMEGRRKA